MLYKHQQECIARAGNTAIFHDPGLGKTLTCLEIFRKHRIQNNSLKLMVICPLSLIEAAWGSDIKKWTNFTYCNLKSYTDSDIVIMNFETLISNKYEAKILDLLKHNSWMCVVDESSRMKSPKSITTKRILSLMNFFEHRYVCSGTPCPNSETELWAQIRFLDPAILPKSFYQFRNMFFQLQRGSNVVNAQMVDWRQMAIYMRTGFKYVIKHRDKLMGIINPVVHWVKQEDAIDLPPETDEIIDLALNPAETKAYKEMKLQAITEVQGQYITAQVALTKLMKLRQCSSGFLYSDKNTVEIGQSRLNQLRELLEDLGSRQVMIFAQFRHEIEQISKMLGDKSCSLYSQTADKNLSINEFKDGKRQYLVAHPRSAAHGLTFTNCNCMVFYSLDFSYEAHEQARKRIYRIGQTKTCLYYYMIAKDTVDTDIFNVITRKKKLSEVFYDYFRTAIQETGIETFEEEF